MLYKPTNSRIQINLKHENHEEENTARPITIQLLKTSHKESYKQPDKSAFDTEERIQTIEAFFWETAPTRHRCSNSIKDWERKTVRVLYNFSIIC